ncbi:MAG: CoA-transferase [Clostridia bacterium]|jgi:propionate CoA-transferase|nr:CoA-transferase [Clostridia bacterium]
MSKVITAEQAIDVIKDGSTIAIGGMGLGGWPEELAKTLENKFLETGHPRDLSVKQGAAIGDWGDRGTIRWGHEGIVKKWAGAHIGAAGPLNKLVREGKVQAHCLPQGVILHLWREIAAHRPGLITKVGLGTFVDPRLEGGRMNNATTEELVKVVEFENEEWLFYKTFSIDVALIRGTTADENGNLTLDKEGIMYEALQIAQATKNTGGIVIAQCEYLAKASTLHPKQVRVPGIMVDYVVQARDKDNCWQTEGLYYEPAFSGDIKIPLEAIPRLPMNERKIIARRCAMELTSNTIVNLGFGMPADVSSVAVEEGISHMMTMTTEAGGVGGVPASPPNFGSSYNADALIEHVAMFDYYDGGGLDVTFLGLAETDKHGNVNVSKFSPRLIGPGGFINISQSAKKAVFCGTFTNGVKVKVEDGKLIIVEEGKRKKFLDHVEQVTFGGQYASKIKQPVLYVTERAVFTLEDGKMTLIEIAPGINLQKDILGQMDFVPHISSQLKEMDSGLFHSVWGGLKEYIEIKEKINKHK